MQQHRITGAAGTGWRCSAKCPLPVARSGAADLFVAHPFVSLGSTLWHKLGQNAGRTAGLKSDPKSVQKCGQKFGEKSAQNTAPWPSAGRCKGGFLSQQTVLISNSAAFMGQSPGGAAPLRRSGQAHAHQVKQPVFAHGSVGRTAFGTEFGTEPGAEFAAAGRPGISSCAQLGGGRECFSEEGDRHVCRAQRDPPPGRASRRASGRAPGRVA